MYSGGSVGHFQTKGSLTTALESDPQAVCDPVNDRRRAEPSVGVSVFIRPGVVFLYLDIKEGHYDVWVLDDYSSSGVCPAVSFSMRSDIAAWGRIR